MCRPRVAHRLVAAADAIDDRERRHRGHPVGEEQKLEAVGREAELPDPRLFADELEAVFSLFDGRPSTPLVEGRRTRHRPPATSSPPSTPMTLPLTQPQ